MSQEKMSRLDAQVAVAEWLTGNGGAFRRQAPTVSDRAAAAVAVWAFGDDDAMYRMENLDEQQRQRQLVDGADEATLISEAARELEVQAQVSPMMARQKAEELVQERKVTFENGAFRWVIPPQGGTSPIPRQTLQLKNGVARWLEKPSGRAWIESIRAQVGDRRTRLVGFIFG